MKLIVGLGNPGKKYELTRHNVGFLFLDYLANELSLDWSEHKKTNSLLAKSADYILVKPQTFMNLSGQTVVAALNFFKLNKEDLIIVHDDIDIDLGKIKNTSSSRAAGNNGVQSIIDQLGSQDFYRLRVGIRTPERLLIPTEKFVLERFKKDELAIIKQQLPQIKKEALG
jgi:PTH1 family peptidyl-tRNA hydrolase